MANNDVVNAWVKDGTPASEPVTVETPATDPTPVTPAVPETPPSVAPVPTPEPVIPAPDTPAVTMAQFIEARRGDEPFQLPEDVLVPLKRNGKIEYTPITQVMTEGMLERDYRLKTADLAAQRLTDEDARAKIKSEQEWLEQERQRLEHAGQDQTAFDDFQEHLRMMRESPRYRQMYQDQRDKRQTDARLEVYEGNAQSEAVQRGVQTVRTMIEDTATRYPGINAERIRQQYGDYLKTADPQQTSLTREAIQAHLDGLFQREAAYVAQVKEPMGAELAAIKQELAALTATMQGTNKQTTHAVQRGKAPNTAPVNGNPPGPTTRQPPTPFPIRDLAKRNAAWARGE